MTRYYLLVNRTKSETKKNLKYKGIEVRVSKEEFISWFMPRDFEGCSVDRIDTNGHYELANMQLIPQYINSGKDKVKSKNGMCRCFSCKQTKLLTEFVKSSRSKITGYSTICKKCESKRTSLRTAK